MTYSTRADIEKIYGKRNVAVWADLDNDDNPTAIAERIAWARGVANAYLDGMLVNGPYDVPFASPYPTLAIHLEAVWAGLLLYDGRQVVSADNPDQLTRQRMELELAIKRIKRGQLRFYGQELKTNVPFIVAETETTDY